MLEARSAGTRLHEDHQSEEEHGRARLCQLAAGIPDVRTVRTVIALLEALYAARGWDLPRHVITP